MASSRTFEFLILFESCFIGLMVLFGESNNSFDQYTTGPLNTIQEPWATLPPLRCVDINSCTAAIATAILFPSLLLYQFLLKIGAGVTLIFGLASALGNSYNIPYLGYVLTAFLVWTVIYGIAILKPGGHGGA